MSEQQYDFVANDFVDGIPSENLEPEYEYLEIALTKEMTMELYVKVPKGFDHKNLKEKDLAFCLGEQGEYWEDGVGFDWFLSRKVDEKTAKKFGYSEI